MNVRWYSSITTRSNWPRIYRSAAHYKKSLLEAVSANTSTTRGQEPRASGQYLQSKPVSVQRVTSCLFSSVYSTIIIVIPDPDSITGTIKIRLFPLPTGRTATSSVCFAIANRTASSCYSVRNWVWSSRKTVRKAFRMSWSCPASESGFSRCKTLGRFKGVSSLTATVPFLFRAGCNNGYWVSLRNVYYR
jgi:hypothetical protein